MSRKSALARPEPTALLRTLTMLRPHVRSHWKLAGGGLLALFADVVLRIIEPWPVKYAVDAVSRALGAHFGEADGSLGAGTVLLLSGLALALVVGLRALANYLSTIGFAVVGARIATELRSRVFAHVQNLTLRYHSRASIGDTSQRLVGDIGRLQEVAVTAGLPLAGNVVTLVVLIIVVLVLNPMLAAIVLLTAAGFLVLSGVSTPRITGAARSTRKGEGKLVGSAAEALGAIRVVQTYNLQEKVATDFTDGNARALKAGVRARRLAARLERSTDVLVGLAQMAVLLVGGREVLRGAMTPGDLMLFLLYLKIAVKPLRDMAKYTGRIARAAASGERIADLLDETSEIQDPADPEPMDTRDGTVALRGITSRDGHGSPLFTGLDLDIPHGQRVALLGPSGAGKTTLTSYLLRLVEPEHGRILVGGRDVAAVRREDLREHISVVLQESVLFATSVRQNIRFGRPGATDREVEEAAVRAGADGFIRALPEGYDTPLGQRGDTLSGGQRQRIAIARALVRRSELVILDEPTAGLDPVSTRHVVDSLAELTWDRTALVITHDPAVLADVDRVLWLEDGRIREDGSPRELAADPDSRYARWLGTRALEVTA